jgi:hypothetical protein
MEPSQIHYIKDSKGQIFEIPDENLDAALAEDDDYEYLYDYKPNSANNAVSSPAPASPELSPDPQPQPVAQPQPQPSSGGTQGVVYMRDKNGSVFEIPHEHVEEAKKDGGVIVNQTFVDPEYDGFLKTAARSAKTIGSEIVGSVPDIAASIYNIPASIQNATKSAMEKIDPNYMGEHDFIPVSQQKELPQIPSVAHAVDSSIDQATGGYTNTKEGDSLQAGLRTATAVATPGGLAKGAAKAGLEGGAKVLGALGSTKPGSLAAAGAAGAVTSEATKAGYGAPAAAGLGLAAGAGVGVGASVASLAKGLNAKIALAKLTGNSPKNFDQKAIAAYEAADLPFSNVTVNESRALKAIDEVVDKTPFYGTRRNKNLSADDQAYAKAVEGAIEKVGKKIIDAEDPSSLDIGHTIQDVFKETESNIIETKNNLYEVADSLLPQGSVGIPGNLANTIFETKDKFKTLLASTDKTKVLGDLETVANGIVKNNNGSKSLIPVPIEVLVETKKDLHDIINWDVKASRPKKVLRNLLAAVNKDIEAYGKKNPEWYKAYKEADKFHGERLGDKAFSSDTVRKKIIGEENPDKIIGRLNDVSDFKAIEQSLDVSDSGRKFYDSIKREKLADLLMGKIIDPKTEGVNYTGFASALGNPKTKELIRYLAGDQYGELVKFNDVAKAAIRRNKRIVNPSGSAPTSLVLKSIAGLFSGSAGLQTVGAAASAAGGVAGTAASLGVVGYALNWLITNKSAFKMGYEGAKKLAAGDTKAANIFSNRLERAMIKDLGEDFVKQFISESNQQHSKQ